MFRFNSNHHLMKWVTLSASAIMMLSIGGGIANVNAQPVHAASAYQLFNKLDSDSQARLISAVNSGEITPAMLQEAKAEYHKNPKQFEALMSEYHYHISPQLLKQAINQGFNTARPAKINGHKNLLNKQNLKNSHKNVRKAHRKARKTTRNNVKSLKQIKGLKREIRHLNRQIKLIKGRKYRTRRAKRNARRQLQKLNRQLRFDNKKLNQLNRQLTKKRSVSHKRRSNKKVKYYTKRNKKWNRKMNKHHRNGRHVKKAHRYPYYA